MDDKSEFIDEELELEQEFKKLCNGQDALLEGICKTNEINPEYIQHILACEREEVHKKKRAGIYVKLREILEVMIK